MGRGKAAAEAAQAGRSIRSARHTKKSVSEPLRGYGPRGVQVVCRQCASDTSICAKEGANYRLIMVYVRRPNLVRGFPGVGPTAKSCKSMQDRQASRLILGGRRDQMCDTHRFLPNPDEPDQRRLRLTASGTLPEWVAMGGRARGPSATRAAELLAARSPCVTLGVTCPVDMS
jgi:hypothetical protein